VYKNIKFLGVFIYLVCSLLSADLFVFAQPPGELCEPKFRHNMYAVCFTDAKLGWACGDNGIVYHTVDGGFNWDIQPVDTTESLFAVSFANSEVGWVVGNKGLIFHTIDGGKTWKSQKSSTEKILFNAKALSADKAIACGDWGNIAYTSDGGETWEDRTYPKDVMMYGIDFVDENEGWIAGEFGMILHTTDSGATWEVQATGVENMLYSVSFSTKLEGLAGGIDGLILRTVDGGNTWQKGEFMTTFNGISYSSFLDTGTNGLFFPSHYSNLFPNCPSPNLDWYCPWSTISLSANNTGSSGSPRGTVSFHIGNFDSLTTSPNNVFAEIGGDGAGEFDWGLPFYFGRNVYIGLEGRESSLGSGLYWAY